MWVKTGRQTALDRPALVEGQFNRSGQRYCAFHCVRSSDLKQKRRRRRAGKRKKKVELGTEAAECGPVLIHETPVLCFSGAGGKRCGGRGAEAKTAGFDTGAALRTSCGNMGDVEISTTERRRTWI